MNIHAVVLVSYALALMAFGLGVGRRVKGSADFFVAGRRLGPGLMFSTMLAANIGAGSTVGATALGYSDGLAAWWWVGSAAIGSTILALWIGPAIRREAAAHELRTVGDYLEYRYGASVRAAIASLLWIASIFILAGQLFAMGSIVEAVAGIPASFGCVIGGVVLTAYFAAGGLLTAAWVNVVQLTVKLAGFAIALPLTLSAVGGWPRVVAAAPSEAPYWTFWRTGSPGLFTLAIIVPAFIVSPGLLQKIFGARDDRAVRIGVGMNALGLFAYAAVPVLLGIVARVQFPALASTDQALPTLLVRSVPPLVGAIGLAAVFSAEISASDAVLLMLTTSLAQDLYKRFVEPAAGDEQVLRVARVATLFSGALGVALAVALGSVINALTIFYTLLGVTLFVPIVGGLYVRRTSKTAALNSIAGGVVAMVTVHAATGGHGWGALTPALAGLSAAVAAWGITLAVIPARHGRHSAVSS